MSSAAPRVIANITLTIDGHTTGPNGPYDMSCIAPYGVSDEARDHLERMTSATTAVMGRSNFEGFGGYWPTVTGDPAADRRDRAFAQWLNDVDKVVFSRSLTEPLAWRNARLANEPPERTIQQLRQTTRGDIRILSSSSMIRQLLDAGQVDQLEINLAPEITTGGEALFTPETTIASQWHLLDATPSRSGAVLLRYERIGATA